MNNPSQAASLEELDTFTAEQKDMVAHLQGVDSSGLPSPSNMLTTPLSQGNGDKIKIVIRGEDQSEQPKLASDDGFQPTSLDKGQLGAAPGSPFSNNSIGGIKVGGKSLSSNTSEENHQPMPSMQTIPETVDENQQSVKKPDPTQQNNELQDTNKTLQLSVLDTTTEEKRDSASKDQ